MSNTIAFSPELIPEIKVMYALYRQVVLGLTKLGEIERRLCCAAFILSSDRWANHETIRSLVRELLVEVVYYSIVHTQLMELFPRLISCS